MMVCNMLIVAAIYRLGKRKVVRMAMETDPTGALNTNVTLDSMLAAGHIESVKATFVMMSGTNFAAEGADDIPGRAQL